VIVGLGAIGIGTTGTILSTRDAEAVRVSMGEMELPDKEHSGEINEIIADVDVEVEYESNNQPDAIKLTMSAGQVNSRLTEIQTETVENLTETSGTTETTISGDILESSSLAKSTWELLPGQPQANVDVEIQITAKLMRNGSTIAEGSVSDTATVTRNKNTGSVELAAEGTLTIS
jgi:hypothetical protein